MSAKTGKLFVITLVVGVALYRVMYDGLSQDVLTMFKAIAGAGVILGVIVALGKGG